MMRIASSATSTRCARARKVSRCAGLSLLTIMAVAWASRSHLSSRCAYGRAHPNGPWTDEENDLIVADRCSGDRRCAQDRQRRNHCLRPDDRRYDVGREPERTDAWPPHRLRFRARLRAPALAGAAWRIAGRGTGPGAGDEPRPRHRSRSRCANYPARAVAQHHLSLRRWSEICNPVAPSGPASLVEIGTPAPAPPRRTITPRSSRHAPVRG